MQVVNGQIVLIKILILFQTIMHTYDYASNTCRISFSGKFLDPNQENFRPQQRRKQKNWKVVKLFLSIIIIFYVTTLPHQIIYMICKILINNTEVIDFALLCYALYSSRALLCLNCCIDPFIYKSFCMKDIKREVRNPFLRH